MIYTSLHSTLHENSSDLYIKRGYVGRGFHTSGPMMEEGATLLAEIHVKEGVWVRYQTNLPFLSMLAGER